MVSWITWLAASLSSVLLAEGLPWLLRIGLVLGLGIPAAVWIYRSVLLRGRLGLRAVEWSAEGRFHVRLGISRHRLPAEPARGCQRYGRKLWILRFDTAGSATTAVIDPSRLDIRATRRLGRQLNVSRRGS